MHGYGRDVSLPRLTLIKGKPNAVAACAEISTQVITTRSNEFRLQYLVNNAISPGCGFNGVWAVLFVFPGESRATIPCTHIGFFLAFNETRQIKRLSQRSAIGTNERVQLHAFFFASAQ
jgi:hypothetical protein